MIVPDPESLEQPQVKGVQLQHLTDEFKAFS